MLPPACAALQEALLADPLNPGPEAEAHLRACAACAEARVVLLAQEEAPQALAPAGYFERLPARVLGKLPGRIRPRHQAHPLLWAAAAVVLAAVGSGAFWAGRANRAPLVEASVPSPGDASENTLLLGDTPFHDRDGEAAARVEALSPEELKALLKRLDERPAKAQ
jgi:hypothetical protein